jgi:hypothetical protein
MVDFNRIELEKPAARAVGFFVVSKDGNILNERTLD